MLKCENLFPLFYEITQTILKKFSQYGLMQYREPSLWKQPSLLGNLTKVFWPAFLSVLITNSSSYNCKHYLIYFNKCDKFYIPANTGSKKQFMVP